MSNKLGLMVQRVANSNQEKKGAESTKIDQKGPQECFDSMVVEIAIPLPVYCPDKSVALSLESSTSSDSDRML